MEVFYFINIFGDFVDMLTSSALECLSECALLS